MNKPAVDHAQLAAMSPLSLAEDKAGVFSDEKNSVHPRLPIPAASRCQVARSER